jgi:hypothetical protein
MAVTLQAPTAHETSFDQSARSDGSYERLQIASQCSHAYLRSSVMIGETIHFLVELSKPDDTSISPTDAYLLLLAVFRQ